MKNRRYYDTRSAENCIDEVYQSLDNMQGRFERKVTLLDTAKHLVGDYCNLYISCKTETPRELKLAIDMLDLIINDSRIESDMLEQDKKLLDKASSCLGC